jgi:predicted ATPase/DNA-binding SARP family transcriptional activator
VVVQIRLLGGVFAATDGGEPVDVGPAKCQAVLAVLALSAGSPVPVARLVQMVWGEDPPRTAEKTLQSYVARLRKGLGPASIVRAGAAYRLDVDADSVDVARFQRRLASGEVGAALAEWTGAPLAGLAAHGLTGTVDALVEQWLGAVEIDLERRVETDAAAAIGPLTELTANHPFREGLWALLMTALYRVGRQADALAAYHRARRHLVEQLGVEPGPRLRELESLILGHDAQLPVDRARRDSATGIPTGTVTFGCSDVEDSSRLWAMHSHAMAAAMARHDELVRAATERHGGYVFATGGDSFGVAFHRAVDAVSWATELQAATDDEPSRGGVPIRLRIGLHTGETEERGKGYFGPAVVVAARLAAAAHGGQTLVSGVTSALLDGRGLRDLGSYRLDDVVAEQRILQLGDGEHPPLRVADGRRGNLPRRSGRLIGRHDDLAVVADALAASPVVTLVGPGGVGKTRLALAAAAQLSTVERGGGAWLIELAGIASSQDVPRAVADVLGVRESPGGTLASSIVATLRSRRALLVLDNCEHVVGGAAELARAVAEGCPDVRVLATSREGLGLGNGTEQLVVVAPLEPTGPGVELFDERAAAVSASFDPRAARDDVEEICRRLDGVPLAIELAAARTRSMTPAELVQRLDDHLRLLTGGRRTSVGRHRTLRATVQWSYDLLSPAEQVLFQRLSIFTGPFDLPAAEAVASDADLDAVDVDERLDGLVERSMVIVESGPFGRRFRLLETLRQFGAEHLSDSGLTDVVAERHARWCLDQVTGIHERLAGRDEIEGVVRLGELWPNLRAAVDWACATRDPALAQALVRPIAAEVYLRSQNEIGDWAERILAVTPPDDQDLILFGLTWAGRRYMRNMDRDGYERLVRRYGEPDHPMIRFARGFLGADYADMATWGARALTELREQGDDYVADRFELAGMGLTLLLSGRLEEHDALVTALVERYRAQGPPTCLNWALTYLGTSASAQGRDERAWRYFDQAAQVAVPPRTSTMRNPLEARTALRRGNRARAFETLRAFVDELLERDNLYMAKIACVEFINMMAAVERWTAAAIMLDHLETSGAFGDAPVLRANVAGAAREVGLHDVGPLRRRLDDTQALAFMRDELDGLAAEAWRAEIVERRPSGR